MLLADMGGLCFFWFLLLCCLPGAIKLWRDWMDRQEAAKQAEAQERFKRENPELWKQQELLKLEKERLATQKELAERQLRQENARRNAGTVVAVGRFLGWW